MNKKLLAIVPAIVMALAATVSAHTGHAGRGSDLAAGMVHPLSGIDHLLAMIAVGMLAAQMGGRALWMLPCAFVLLMAGGGLMNGHVSSIPMIEQGIAASVLVLGVLIASAVRLRAAVVATLVGSFAILHGYAHVGDLGAGHSVAEYGAGFMLATAGLHALGIALALIARRTASGQFLRLGGATIAGCGVLLLLGLI